MLEQADDLFKRGALGEAFLLFERVAAKANVRTRQGGMATLQKAVILDSYGANSEAQVRQSTTSTGQKDWGRLPICPL